MYFYISILNVISETKCFIFIIVYVSRRSSVV